MLKSLSSWKQRARLAGIAVIPVVVVSGLVALDLGVNGAPCPAGYSAVEPAAVAREFNPNISARALDYIRGRFGEHGCLWNKAPESFTEFTGAQAALAPSVGVVPEGARRRAVEQKAALKAASAKVTGADGQWQEYGVGPQVSDQLYADGARDGIPEVAGRADNFAYDSVAKRLFVSITYGGVWMSEAVDGDIATLGNHWTPIGDNLPTLINSAVAWTPAHGGRVIVLTGEHTQGGNTYVGLGAYWSDDLGATWHHAEGVPDGAGAGRLAVDLANPSVVYAASHKGLFRSNDGGASFVNVGLPVSEECAGKSDGACQLANVVTDVVIRQPGGVDATALSPTVCDPKGCSVLAAVGYRGGAIPYADGKVHSPGNGLYRSATGEPGTWVKLVAENDAGLGLVPAGFAPQNRVGRIEMAAAEGPEQDHNVVYAIVQDALLFNNGLPVLDIPSEEKWPALPVDCQDVPDGDPRFVCESYAGGFNPTAINGVYVSTDFGTSWTKLADDVELTYNLTTGSTLAAVVALGIGPGVQAWYDLWIKPDPTQAVGGFPTRVLFAMEEIWKNRTSSLPLPVIGAEQTTNDFEVIGTYFAGETCLFLIGNIGPATPVCPTYDGVINGTTTHPDQHDGIFIPDEQRGGVWLFAGNDGGVYKQYSADPATDDFANNKWGDGANRGFYTLFNYGISVAKDGTVYYGLQDNASGKIEPTTRRQVRTYVGDGMWTEVDPDNSHVAYVQTPGLSINRTTDGGITHTSIAPDTEAGVGHFLSPFMLDPTDAGYMVAAGTMVAALSKPASNDTWVTMFDLGVDEASGQAHQTRSRALDVQGAAVYAGWCGPCQVLNGVHPGGTFAFKRGLATNVGGTKPPKKGSPNGWHHASANGLPNRYIYSIEIDAADPKTVYVVLGDYSTSRWLTTGQYEDGNANIGAGHVFKSTDAGENFVDITGNLPDTIATAILKRGNQLIVGTDIGVFISSDLDGSEWAPLGSMQNVPVNELRLRPGNPNQLFAGTFGRGVQVYEFTGDAVMAPSQAADKQGRGMFLGALPPALLLVLAGLALVRTTRRRDH